MRILSLPLPCGAVKRALFLALASLLLQVAVLGGCVADVDVDDVLPRPPPICACDPPMRLDLRAADAGAATPTTSTTTERDR